MTKEEEENELLAIAAVRYPIDTKYIGLHGGDKKTSEHEPKIMRNQGDLYGIDVGLDYVYRPSMGWASVVNELGEIIEFPEFPIEQYSIF